MASENEGLARRFLAGASSLDEYLDFFHDDCIYKVANQPAVHGKAALAQAAASFRSRVQRVEHRLLSLWCIDDRVVCELEATYTRSDDQIVTIPCLDLFTIRDNKIAALQIFADMVPVFQP
jgi:hypothetical protein